MSSTPPSMSSTTASLDGEEDQDMSDCSVAHNKSYGICNQQLHWEEVCRAFRHYAVFAQYQWLHQRSRLDALPESTRRLLPAALQNGTPESRKRALQYKEAYIRNQVCLDSILSHKGVPTSQQVEQKQPSRVASDSYLSKVSEVLKSLYRDWSVEGRVERDMSYKPLLQSIQKELPIINGDSVPKLCVPGAGVGRFAFELASLGYHVQGNEFSLFHLLASDFVFNSGNRSPKNQLYISPWLLETRNVHGAKDPFRKIAIPDVDASSVLLSSSQAGHDRGGFSMAAGDFLSIYNDPSQHGQWDGIVSCFFLDTAYNMVEYLETMYNMLRDDGVLINLGPFLHSWSGPAMRPEDVTFERYKSRNEHHGFDRRYLESIDLCWEDVREILVNIGFVIEEERTGIRALYAADRKSMMNVAYRCVHFVARKKVVGGRPGKMVRTMG